AFDYVADGCAFHCHRRFHRAGTDDYHFYAASECADRGRKYQSCPYGRRVDRNPRIRVDYAALRTCSAHGLEIRRDTFLAGPTGGLPDLRCFFDHNGIHLLFPVGCTVAPETRSAGLGRLFPKSEWPRLYLPAIAYFACASIRSIRLPNGPSTWRLPQPAIGLSPVT